MISKIGSILANISYNIKNMNLDLYISQKNDIDIDNFKDIVLYYKREIIGDINKLEIHCRALRDKLENG